MQIVLSSPKQKKAEKFNNVIISEVDGIFENFYPSTTTPIEEVCRSQGDYV